MSERVWWCWQTNMIYRNRDGIPVRCAAETANHDECGWRLLVDPVSTLIVEKGEDGEWPGWALDAMWGVAKDLDALKVAYDSQLLEKE